MSSDLMETEAGGESTQYESIQTVTKSHLKQNGQFDDNAGKINAQDNLDLQEQAEQGGKTAEDLDSSQTALEQDMGGSTTTSGGKSDAETGYGESDTQTGGNSADETRRTQGYGTGSGVGA